jgi:hypothetical protein
MTLCPVGYGEGSVNSMHPGQGGREWRRTVIREAGLAGHAAPPINVLRGGLANLAARGLERRVEQQFFFPAWMLEG